MMISVLAQTSLLLALFAGSPQIPRSIGSEGEHVPGEVIVGLQPGLSLEAAAHLAAQCGLEVVEHLERSRLVLLRDPGGRSAQALSDELSRDPHVRFAHPNWIGSGGFVPNDTHYDRQWHHSNTGQSGGRIGADIETPAAWNHTRGSASIVVAVLDTGIDRDHPDFLGRSLPGHDFVDEDANPEADHPHGIQVTGLIAATADNQHGVAGVDHFCTILPVKVLDRFNRGTTFDLVQGIDYAAASGANVLSMSLINYPVNEALREALAAARQTGAILIACAGNGGLGDADRSWPGASPDTISIGATDDRDRRASFSGTGNRLDLVAPGEAVITSSWVQADTAEAFTGCSAATPIVAGLTSLCLSLDPSLSQEQIFELLVCGAEDRVGGTFDDTAGWDRFYGWGRVNARRTLLALQLFRVDSITPARGSFRGGDTITLIGAGFTAATIVVIGDAVATQVNLLGPNQLQVRTPPRALPDSFETSGLGPGQPRSTHLGERVDVVILDHGCRRTVEDGFHYLAR
ncbi:MAG: S8 family serine peptidase [Planctomycetota bacterium]